MIKLRIWLRIAHFKFQGFSEFGSYHLAGFLTKAQSNQVRSVYQFRHIPLDTKIQLEFSFTYFVCLDLFNSLDNFFYIEKVYCMLLSSFFVYPPSVHIYIYFLLDELFVSIRNWFYHWCIRNSIWIGISNIYTFPPTFHFYSANLNSGTVDIHSFFSSYLFPFRIKPEECLILI